MSCPDLPEIGTLAVTRVLCPTCQNMIPGDWANTIRVDTAGAITVVINHIQERLATECRSTPADPSHDGYGA